MNEPTVTWNSLSTSLRAAVILMIISSGLSILSSAKSFVSSGDEGQHETAAESGKSSRNAFVSAQGQTAQVGPDLNCLIQDVKTSGKHTIEAGTFTCGDMLFAIVSYSGAGANTWLGGGLPDNKSLKSLGCQVAGDKVLCREEKEYGPRLTAYRSFTATYKKIAPAQ